MLTTCPVRLRFLLRRTFPACGRRSKRWPIGKELFRASFHMGPDGLYCHLADRVMFELPVLEALSLEQAARRLSAPFDLAKAPLFRAALWTDGAGSLVFADGQPTISSATGSARRW